MHNSTVSRTNETAGSRRHAAADEFDVAVLGSGAAALVAALTLAVAGRRVIIIEKTGLVGGTSAMSGGMTWIPANHYAEAAGIEDSPEAALDYLRAAAPAGWREVVDELWKAQVANGHKMLRFIEEHSPIRFTIANVPDPIMELPGARELGRLLSPEPLSARILGKLAGRIRHSTMPNLLTYRESIDARLYRQPILGNIRYAFVSLARWLTRTRGKGNALIIGLLKGCLEHGCKVELKCRAVSLTTERTTGSVDGVVVEQNGARRRISAAQGVVVATGGFEWNRELLEQYFPPVDYLSSPASNEGDGHLMARDVGASFRRMDQANVMIQAPIPYEGRINGLPVKLNAEPDSILVNQTGKRFASEYKYHIGETLLERSTESGEFLHHPVWMISHWPMVKRTPVIWWYRRYDTRWLVKARTIPELARKIGLAPEVLEETVSRFNGFCRAGHDADHHRGSSIYERKLAKDLGLMKEIDTPPFVAIRANPSLMGTRGGIRTNADGQALREDDSIIGGLYCAGNVMANPIGTRTPSQIGTTIGPYMTWGYICANSILRNNFP